MLATCIFIVALLYALVGHGGASGYLAVVSLFGLSPEAFAVQALLLNLLVASIAWVQFFRAGFFNWRLTAPFVLIAAPCAFLGGFLHVSSHLYEAILAIVLLLTSLHLLFFNISANQQASLLPSTPSLLLSGTVSAIVGFVSGLLGVGGGIFLSPILLYSRWATIKQTAATSACFIVVNSFTGLIGRILRPGFVWDIPHPEWFVIAMIGSLVGACFGAKKVSPRVFKQVLGLVILMAALKLAAKSLGH